MEQRVPNLDPSLPVLWRFRRSRFPSPPSAAFPTLSTALGASQYWFRIMYSSGIIRLQERINSVYLIGFKAAHLKQPAALPLSLPSRERHGSRQPPEPVGLSQHRVSVLLKPVSEIRLTGNTFLCKSAVSPACHATEQPGPAVQRPKPSPSWSIKRYCLGSIPEQAFWHPQCRSWLPPAPPCDRGLQTL